MHKAKLTLGRGDGRGRKVVGELKLWYVRDDLHVGCRFLQVGGNDLVRMPLELVIVLGVGPPQLGGTTI